MKEYLELNDILQYIIFGTKVRIFDERTNKVIFDSQLELGYRQTLPKELMMAELTSISVRDGVLEIEVVDRGMREILFRGKRVDNGEWFYGDVSFGYESEKSIKPYRALIGGKYKNLNIDFDNSYAFVIPQTVGQFTGLTDKNGKKIFEGDIIKWDENEWGGKFSELVKWDYKLFNMRQNDWKEFCEIIGNIHDNKELLEEAE